MNRNSNNICIQKERTFTIEEIVNYCSSIIKEFDYDRRLHIRQDLIGFCRKCKDELCPNDCLVKIAFSKLLR